MHEIVLDTNVLVAALRSTRGASYELVRSIRQADWRLNISVALALEYEDVLKRKDMVRGMT
jgi:predicted nucleic acid-binding protein